MPIKAELLKFYSASWKNDVRPRILARAGNRCEECRVPNRRFVARVGQAWWDQGRRQYFSPDGSRPRSWKHPHTVLIVLTIAHLNHVPGDDGDANLKALCQWCHLNYDRLHHAETRATRKDLARPLLSEAC